EPDLAELRRALREALGDVGAGRRPGRDDEDRVRGDASEDRVEPRKSERVADVVEDRVEDGLGGLGLDGGDRPYAHPVSDRSAFRSLLATSSSIFNTMDGSRCSMAWNGLRFTVIVCRGVSAMTDAERGPPSSRAISPKKSPGMRFAIVRPRCTTLAWPRRIT